MATHQRAAEITYVWKTGLTYEVTITMFTYTPSPADDVRTSLPISWGDNTQSDIPRVTFQALPDNYTLNTYRMDHTFPGSGSYVISVEDPNRNFGVVNIPNSVNVPIYVESLLVINPFLDVNNSVQLLNAPIDQGCVGRLYVHNPSAFDPDGDSLSYELVNCRGSQGLEIPGYTLPLASTSFSIDAKSGDLSWDAPVLQGEYNVAFKITEWREGVAIGSVVRDMQILIGACDNNPPVISLQSSQCVTAGQQLMFDISATDPDNNAVTLTGTGAPLEVEDPAALIPDPATGTPTASTTFYWNTLCQHIQKGPYSLLFKAKDNHPEVSLTSFRAASIQVIAPAIDTLIAQALGTGINLSWAYTSCSNASGYKVYRKFGTSDFVPGSCETGVPSAAGFSLIATLAGGDQTNFRDNETGNGLSPGVMYCYLVTAIFADGAESQAGDVACASLKSDLPVMTHVSNDSLNLQSGKVLLAWAAPTELDTQQYPGPYEYQVFRIAPGQETLIYTGVGLNDTLCTDAGINLNVIGTAAIYEVRLKSNSAGNIGSSRKAGSVFLTATPSDQSIQLSWQADVPWNNSSTNIYRLDGDNFVQIGSSTTNSFVDAELINGNEYSYYVQTEGSFGTSGFIQPIHNSSQLVSASPIDNVAPCTPDFSVETNCRDISNLIKLLPVADSCPADVKAYELYFSAIASETPSLIASLGPFETSYIHQNMPTVTGCYYLQAVDSTGNISLPSPTVCVNWDACPVYELPNVFTPNADQFNDQFIPIGYPSTNPRANVEKIELNIFNRWGTIVFQTDDPLIGWDGKDQRTGADCAPGTYFYTCKVFVKTLEGLREQQLQGSVTIVR